MQNTLFNFRNTLKISLFILISLFIYLPAQTQDRSSLVFWDFNQPNRPQGNAPWVGNITANQGQAELSFNFSTTGDRPVTSFSGSTEDLDGFGVSESGGSFVPQGEKENGNHFQFVVDTRGYQNLTLSYATRGTSAGFQSQTWFVSVNQGDWLQVSFYSGITSSYELRTIDLSAYDNTEILGIRCVVDGASSETGNNRFDNIRVTGELETVNLQLSTSSISFDAPTSLGNFSSPLPFTIDGIATSAVLEIRASEYFEISKTLNGTYTNSISIAPEETASGIQVYVRFAAPDQSISGIISGSISFNLDPSQLIQLNAVLSGIAFGLPFRENFDNPNLFVLPNWQRFQEAGEQNWTITDENRYTDNPYSARMNGFSAEAKDNRTWLVSPPVALDAIADNQFLILEFESRSFFANGTPLLRVFASTNYDRTADPLNEKFNWVEIPISLPLETGKWKSTGETNLTSLGEAEKMSIAIVYESIAQENGAAEWMIDNFKLYASEQSPEPIINTSNWSLADYHFGVIAPGQSSAIRTMTLTASNLASPLTLTADPGIEVAISDNFSTQLVLSNEDFPASGVLTINTRMTANDDPAVLAQAGSINLSTEGMNDTTFGYFNHATIDKEATFDVVTWNIEWFGDPANATTPSADLQRRSVRELIKELDADVYAFQEITSIPTWNFLVAELEEYTGVLSPAYSQPAGNFDAAQKLAFLFKKSTVDTISTRVFFENLKEEDLTDYPVANKGLFWASGRLPFAMDIAVTIGNIKRELTLVNIHARSNGGGESENLPRYQLRKYDVEVLYDSLREHYDDKSIILLGDYNDDILSTVAPVDEPTVPDNGESSYIKFISDSANFLGVSMPMSKAGMRSFVSSENMIDHILINKNLFEDHINEAERVVIPYANFPDYNATTSDHFPVEARFLLSGENILTSIENVKKTSLLYPNPSDGIIYFSGFDHIQEVEILSITGQKLVRFEGDVKRIDLKHLNQGVYLLKINSTTGQEIKRVVLN